MSAIISALDNYTPSQIGENGSIEYTWSNNIRERILQISFQLTRNKTRDSTQLHIQMEKILQSYYQIMLMHLLLNLLFK